MEHGVALPIPRWPALAPQIARILRKETGLPALSSLTTPLKKKAICKDASNEWRVIAQNLSSKFN